MCASRVDIQCATAQNRRGNRKKKKEREKKALKYNSLPYWAAIITRTHHTRGRRMLPSAYRHPLYSTRLLHSIRHQDCDSSFLLLRDCHLESRHPCNHWIPDEACSMTSADTLFHSPSYSRVRCTFVLLELLYILYIHIRDMR